MSIGSRIKEARKNAKLTQQELAEIIGVAQITIRQYESNKRQPRIEQLDFIAKKLDVDSNWLLTGQPSSPTVGEIVTDKLRLAGLSFTEAAEKAGLTPDELRAITKSEHIAIENYQVLAESMREDDLLSTIFFGTGINLNVIAADICKKYKLDDAIASQIVDDVIDTCRGYFRTKDEEVIARLLWMLNADGKAEATKRVEELTEISRYQAENEPESSDNE